MIFILWGLRSTFKTRASIPSSFLSFFAWMLICPLSYYEGRKSIRPSSVLQVYLFGSALLDIAQVRTLWLAGVYDSSLQRVAIATTVSLCLKLVLLILETMSKTTLNPQEHESREETCGVYSRRTFWWLNRILWLGRQKNLNLSDLYHIDSGLKTARYSSTLATTWNKGQSLHATQLQQARKLTTFQGIMRGNMRCCLLSSPR